MAHRITCLIPTCKNTCGRNNTKTTFLEIFFIGYHFITARKVSSAISSLNVGEKTFETSRNTKPRVTPRRCANLSLRYRLRNSIQLALTLLFTFKMKRMTVSCFVFGVQYVCHHTGKAKPDVKLFGVLGRRTEERELHPG